MRSRGMLYIGTTVRNAERTKGGAESRATGTVKARRLLLAAQDEEIRR
jgi:hypothetical protein